MTRDADATRARAARRVGRRSSPRSRVGSAAVSVVTSTAMSIAMSIACGAVALAPTSARADPSIGEARSILRDMDHAYTTVAGEGDALATVSNPANLGYLTGFGTVGELTLQSPDALRRGAGGSAFFAFPIAFRLLGRALTDPLFTLAFGYQHLAPLQPPLGGDVMEIGGVHVSADGRFNKLSFALGIPLSRWAKGLAAGVSYHRLWSHTNAYGRGVNQLDVALAWWANRYVALGAVGRGVNLPWTGEALPGRAQEFVREVRQPLELDLEVALRPTGDRWLELAAGARFMPIAPDDAARFTPYPAQPRGRLFVGGKGVRVFAEVEGYRALRGVVSTPDGDIVDDDIGVRVQAGLELDFQRVGVALGPTMGADGPRVQGGTLRVRAGAEAYASAPVRARRRVTRLSLSAYKGDRGLAKLITFLDEQPDHGASALLLELSGGGYGWAQVEELRAAMARARARGQKLVVYVRGGSLKTYFLAAAADRVIVHPRARVTTIGMHMEVFYFAELLGKLGAKAEFLRVAEFKARPEQLHRTGATDPVKRQREQLLIDTWNHVVRRIAVDRGATPEQVAGWVDAAPHAPAAAQGLGMVDALAYPDELEQRVGEWLGHAVTIKPPPRRPRHRDAYGPAATIAVLRIHGVMRSGESVYIPLIGRELVGDATLVPEINRLAEAREVKAIVVRIDSVGGSVACADAIARALDQAAARKPVIISFGDVAASGGYYVATAGDTIFTSATTRTGSIGTFLPNMDLSGVLEKLGVGLDAYGLGAHAGMYSWFKPYSESERRAAATGIQRSYDEFVARVADSRGLSAAEVDALARGRVWSGARALENGLADRYGGLRDAVEFARMRAGLAGRPFAVTVAPAEPGLLRQIESLFGLRLPVPLGSGSNRHVSNGGLELAAAGALALGGGGPVVAALRRVPAVLWMSSSPEPLALAEEHIEIH